MENLNTGDAPLPITNLFAKLKNADLIQEVDCFDSNLDDVIGE